MAYNYDAQIARLNEQPEKIEREWFDGIGLFRVMGRDRDATNIVNDGPTCGCLTQIRFSKDKAAFVNGSPDKDLTQAIREDKRLPIHVSNITPAHLTVFKEWQQFMDDMGRK